MAILKSFFWLNLSCGLSHRGNFCVACLFSGVQAILSCFPACFIIFCGKLDILILHCSNSSYCQALPGICYQYMLAYFLVTSWTILDEVCSATPIPTMLNHLYCSSERRIFGDVHSYPGSTVIW